MLKSGDHWVGGNRPPTKEFSLLFFDKVNKLIRSGRNKCCVTVFSDIEQS